MTRRLPLRRPVRKLASGRAGARSLWRQPLTLIFRARRNLQPSPVVNYHSTDGARITLAPRLQVALHLWTRFETARHEHHALHLHAHATTLSPVSRLFRTRQVHIRPGETARLEYVAGGAVVVPGPVPARPHPVIGETLTLYRQAGMPSTSEPGPRRARIMLGEPAALQLRRVASPMAPAIGRPVVAAPRPTSDSPRRFASVLAHQLGDPAPVARTAALTIPVRARRRFAASEGVEHVTAPRRAGRTVATAALARRAAAMTFAAPTTAADRRRQSAAGIRIAESARPHVSAASLDFRRPAPPVPVPEAARPAPAAPTPSAPAIDVDALSRDVMNRIEKRLRIERERHGR